MLTLVNNKHFIHEKAVKYCSLFTRNCPVCNQFTIKKERLEEQSLLAFPIINDYL